MSEQEEQFPGKKPGDENKPAEAQPGATTGAGDGTEEAVGDGPSGGAPSGTTGGGGDSEATGAGPSGGAVE